MGISYFPIAKLQFNNILSKILSKFIIFIRILKCRKTVKYRIMHIATANYLVSIIKHGINIVRESNEFLDRNYPTITS